MTRSLHLHELFLFPSLQIGEKSLFTKELENALDRNEWVWPVWSVADTTLSQHCFTSCQGLTDAHSLWRLVYCGGTNWKWVLWLPSRAVAAFFQQEQVVTGFGAFVNEGTAVWLGIRCWHHHHYHHHHHSLAHFLASAASSIKQKKPRTCFR